MGPEREDLPLEYRLKAVRIGLQATVLTVLALGVYPFLPFQGPMRAAPYFAILGAAAAGGVGVALLPWRRLFESGHGNVALYIWSLADIAMITGLIAVSGGPESHLFVVYGLTTIFFAISYPRRGQLGLMGFTLLAYGGLAVVSEHGSVAQVFIRLAILGVIAFLASFLSGELQHHVAAAAHARSEADDRANLLGVVARAGRAMSTLDPDLVLGVVSDSAVALGFEASDIEVFDEERRVTVSVEPRGLPEAYVTGRQSLDRGILGEVYHRKATVICDDYSSERFALPVIREAGFRAVVATPIWSGEAMIGALVAGTRVQRHISAQEIEALELLASQAGIALENARRFLDERRSVERLAEVDRMKDEFLSTVSHELRTPLTAISTAGLLLEQRWGQLDDPLRLHIVERLNANARTLEGIIMSLLDFSRFESGQPILRCEATDLGGLVRSAGHRLSALFTEHDLVVDADDDLIVEGDPMLLDRVVENLLSNAAKHTPPGSRITLSASAHGEHVAVSVSDDGRGIPSEEVARLTEPFYRGREATIRRIRGIGLGLSLVSGILELHGSELTITSAVGSGSTFGFEMPLVATGERLAQLASGA